MCLFTKKWKISNNSEKNCFWRAPFSTILECIFHKKHLTKNRALYLSRGLMFWDYPKDKKPEEDLLESFFVFRSGGSHRLRGWEKNKTNRRKKKKQNKVLREILCPKISSRGLFLFSFWFFSLNSLVLTRTLSSATWLREYQKKLAKKQKDKVLPPFQPQGPCVSNEPAWKLHGRTGSFSDLLYRHIIFIELWLMGKWDGMQCIYDFRSFLIALLAHFQAESVVLKCFLHVCFRQGQKSPAQQCYLPLVPFESFECLPGTSMWMAPPMKENG